MINKIKDLMQTKEQIDIIKNNLKYTTNSVSELKNEQRNVRLSFVSRMTYVKSLFTIYLRDMTIPIFEEALAI